MDNQDGMPSSPKPVSKTELRRLIGEPDFSRGQGYFRARRVRSSELDPGRDRALGKVEGSKRRPYEQSITLQWDADGRLSRIKGRCSCPVGSNCKHVAAVMLTLLPELNQENSAALPATSTTPSVAADEPQITGHLGGWLGRLEEITAPAPARVGKASGERLHYLLKSDPAGCLEIELYKIRKLKSGDLSRSTQRFNLSPNLPTAGFLELADISILSRLWHLQRLAFTGGFGIKLDARKLDAGGFGDRALVDLVKEIIATGRARALTLQHPALQWRPPRKVRFAWQEERNGSQKLTVIGHDMREVATLATIPPLFVDPRDGACGELQSEADPRLALALVTMPPVSPAATRKIASALSRFEAAPPPKSVDMIIRDNVRPIPVLRLFAVDGRMLHSGGRRYGRGGYGWDDVDAAHVTVPILRPSFDYDGHSISPVSGHDPDYREGDKHVTIRRDRTFEKQALGRLRELDDYGVSGVDDVSKDIYGIKGARQGDLMLEVETEMHLAHELDHLALALTREVLEPMEAQGWRIEIDDSWPYRFFDGKLDIQAGVDKAEQDWFAFSLTAIAGQQQLDLLPLVLQVIDTLDLDPSDERENEEALDAILDEWTFFLDLPDGRRVPIEGSELAPLVRACLAARALLEGFHPGEAGEVPRLADALEGSGVRFHGGEGLMELGRKLLALRERPEVPPPPSLNATLRHYQKAGYGWLRALADTGFGGVLADDMGLGKTVQALALLCERHLEQGTDRTSLLIVPTSLIGNWRREAARFAPGLRLLVLHGPDRHRHFERIQDHHLIVTTYPLLHRDSLKLFAQPFELAILDEAQAVKNPASEAAKLIRQMDARQRLALTGTPIENNLEELWAIYDWVVPGLLGNRKTFRQSFRHRIEQGGDASAGQRLATRIRPFLLRRTKEEVATDLPTKTEIDEVIRLEGRQRDLYETVRVAMDARVREAIARDGLASTRITVLDALLKMRQACCDPQLVKLDAAKKVRESAKRTRLLAMLEELLVEGRKVLVFSQFVEMLTLIEKDLQARNIDYALLTGQTKKRTAVIDRFQTGKVPLFLVSLKAGGVGLNLTAADTVIIFDPWWNPAVERQAMDRTHRIGQDKPVFVYKLIAEGSVEAAIQAMQQRKQALADNLFAGTRSGALAIGESDIDALFAPLGD